MIFLAAVLLGILTGFLCKGKLNGLTNLNLKSAWLLFLFFCVDVFLNSRFSTILAGEPYRWAVLALLTVQYGAMFALVLINRVRWPLFVIGLGEGLNFLVILANGGRMPVDTSLLPATDKTASLLSGAIPHYGALTSETHLVFLGDVILLQGITRSLISIGDIVILAGLFLFVLQAMSPALFKKKAEQPSTDA